MPYALNFEKDAKGKKILKTYFVENGSKKLFFPSFYSDEIWLTPASYRVSLWVIKFS